MDNTYKGTFNVLAIMRGTTVDGPGFRTSIYLAGCTHHCPGCHNPTSWDESGGEVMTLQDIMNVVDEENFNVTLSGGDPLFNPGKAKILIDTLSAAGRKVWVYTGYTWEEILENPELLATIENAEVVVEGRFIEKLKDPDLLFRGSANQRIISVKESLAGNSIVLYNR